MPAADTRTAFQEHTLGQTRVPIKLATRGDQRQAMLRMVTQSRRTIDIVSRHLDPLIFDDRHLVDAFKSLALRNRKAKIRLLILDPSPLLHRNHRLLELALRLSSFFELRSPPPEHRHCNESMLIADRKGYVHSGLSDRYEGVANFHAPDAATELQRRFDELWQTALPDPNLRRLSL
ncbi:MAG: hypothetical protein M3436_03850 [Pseudomonadota bacterium]|nr:hypothetical protein [Pseudomonadota bacterium]